MDYWQKFRGLYRVDESSRKNEKNTKMTLTLLNQDFKQRIIILAVNGLINDLLKRLRRHHSGTRTAIMLVKVI